MNVTILTEAGSKSGFGHYYRCVSITQALRARRISYTMYVAPSDTIRKMKRIPHVYIRNWGPLKSSTDVVLVDSYKAGRQFYSDIAFQKPLVVFDDTNRLSYPKSLIINGAIGAETITYPQSDQRTYALGPRYTPLRSIFRHPPARLIIRKKVRTILVSLGGSNQSKLILHIMKALRTAYPTITFHVPSGQMDENAIFNLMLTCDMAVSGAGQTLNELIRVGLPTVAISVAQNQKYNISSASENGLIEFAGLTSDSDIVNKVTRLIARLFPYESRREMHTKMVRTLDGRGSDRIALEIKKYYESFVSHK